MSQQTRLKLRIISICIVLLAVSVQLKFVIIPGISPYLFWFGIVAFVMLLIAGQ